jgi:hypothetical protein
MKGLKKVHPVAGVLAKAVELGMKKEKKVKISDLASMDLFNCGNPQIILGGKEFQVKHF